jgi:hypothetical protein
LNASQKFPNPQSAPPEREKKTKKEKPLTSLLCKPGITGCHLNDGNTTNGKHGYRTAKSDKTRTRGNMSGPTGDTSRNKASTVEKTTTRTTSTTMTSSTKLHKHIYIYMYVYIYITTICKI